MQVAVVLLVAAVVIPAVDLVVEDLAEEAPVVVALEAAELVLAAVVVQAMADLVMVVQAMAQVTGLAETLLALVRAHQVIPV